MVISLYLGERIPIPRRDIIQLKERTPRERMEFIGVTATLQITPSTEMAFGPDIVIYSPLRIL